MSLGMGEGMSDDHGPRLDPRLTVQCSCGSMILEVYARLEDPVSVATLHAACRRCGGEVDLKTKYLRPNQGSVITLEAKTP